MAEARKAKITLGGIPLAATSNIAWQFVAGTQPYSTTFTVHKDQWEVLKGQIGQPLVLKIKDSRGKETNINQVYILHEVPSDSPHRRSFVVADKRWKWPYKLVARDFNMPRKTGDRTAFNQVPIENQIVVDEYDYLPYSLKDEQGAKWTAKEVIEEVMNLVDDQITIRNFPIADGGSTANTGEFTVAGLTLRDAGDLALSRALALVPGADVWVRPDGVAEVFDSTDLDELKQYYGTLPVDTYAGERPVWVDRKAIRPSKIVVHYQREVEVMLEFEDDYSGQTSAQPASSVPFVENVLPTVDPQTIVYEYDPAGVGSGFVPKTVPPGTWVRVDNWLIAMDLDKPENSAPWTFDTLKHFWVRGLEAVLGAGGQNSDIAERANIGLRIQALRQHFRQTFRINRNYMERIRSLRNVRVGLLDPVTGARAPAAVWGQICIVPSDKGQRLPRRGNVDPKQRGLMTNYDYLLPSQQGEDIIRTETGPAEVNIIDPELGIFRVDWKDSPYGTTGAIYPCNLVNEQNFNGIVVKYDLSKQEDQPMGFDMTIEGATSGLWLDPTTDLKVLLTMVPAAPNNEMQFHREEVEAKDVASVFRKEFGIKDGDGPEMHVFVPPGEATARFALTNESQARLTIQDLLGLRESNGIEGEDLPGYTLVNRDRELRSHAISLAAELLSPYADNVQGTLVTPVPEGGVELHGNMAGATIRVATAPSARVDAVHVFPGQRRQISRLALMPESTRHIVLGIVPFK